MELRLILVKVVNLVILYLIEEFVVAQILNSIWMYKLVIADNLVYRDLQIQIEFVLNVALFV